MELKNFWIQDRIQKWNYPVKIIVSIDSLYFSPLHHLNSNLKSKRNYVEIAEQPWLLGARNSYLRLFPGPA